MRLFFHNRNSYIFIWQLDVIKPLLLWPTDASYHWRHDLPARCHLAVARRWAKSSTLVRILIHVWRQISDLISLPPILGSNTWLLGLYTVFFFNILLITFVYYCIMIISFQTCWHLHDVIMEVYKWFITNSWIRVYVYIRKDWRTSHRSDRQINEISQADLDKQSRSLEKKPCSYDISPLPDTQLNLTQKFLKCFKKRCSCSQVKSPLFWTGVISSTTLILKL